MMSVKRLFFALWPSAEISQAIQGNNQIIEQSVNGNFVVQSNWHVTLAFLGDCDQSTVNCLIENANTIRLASFEVEFNSDGICLHKGPTGKPFNVIPVYQH